MSAAQLTLDDKRTQSALAMILARGGDTRSVLKNIGEYEAPATVDRIRQEVSPDGTPFAPLNTLYAEGKAKRGNKQGILRGETGDLETIIYQLASDTELEIGNNAVHGAIHQFGGVIRPVRADALVFSMGGRTIRAKSVTIPARPYLGFSPEDIDQIGAIISDFYFEEPLDLP